MGASSVMIRTSCEAENTWAESQASCEPLIRHPLCDRHCFSHSGHSSEPARQNPLASWS